MSITTAPPRPRAFRWSPREFHKLGDQGYFTGRQVLLLGGEIIEMPAMSEPHATSLMKGKRALEPIFAADHHVRPQLPFHAPNHSDPEPDLAVVPGEIEDYERAHPTGATLILEVCLSTADIDKGYKPHLYAWAGVADYWVLDLNLRRLEVYRNPRPDPAAKLGHRYDPPLLVPEGDSIAPLARPQDSIAVAALLPRPTPTADP